MKTRVWRLMFLFQIGLRPSIIYHNFQRVFFLSLTLFYINLEFGRPKSIKPSPDCFRIISGNRNITFPNVFLLLSSYVNLCSMTFCSSRKLLSNAPSERGYPTKIHFLKHRNKSYCVCSAMRFAKIQLYSQGCIIFLGGSLDTACAVLNFLGQRNWPPHF